MLLNSKPGVVTECILNRELHSVLAPDEASCLIQRLLIAVAEYIRCPCQKDIQCCRIHTDVSRSHSCKQRQSALILPKRADRWRRHQACALMHFPIAGTHITKLGGWSFSSLPALSQRQQSACFSLKTAACTRF